jgi:hypothetical protein
LYDFNLVFLKYNNDPVKLIGILITKICLFFRH